MDNPQNEARFFIYDLANLAKEHWFKPDERWALSLANEAEKTAVEKNYYPTLYIEGETEELKKIDALMRNELHLPQPEIEVPDERRARKLPATYLIAYNPGRQRK